MESNHLQTKTTLYHATPWRLLKRDNQLFLFLQPLDLV
jgi:hypothetical protein